MLAAEAPQGTMVSPHNSASAMTAFSTMGERGPKRVSTGCMLDSPADAEEPSDAGETGQCLIDRRAASHVKQGARAQRRRLTVAVARYFRETLDSRLCNLHSNSDRGRPDWRTIDSSVPARNSL